MVALFDRSWQDAAGQGAVHTARTQSELEELGRLRYKRFVVDQGQPYKPTNNSDPMLIDPVDRFSVNLYIRRRETIDVAVRLSWSADVSSSDYLSLLLVQLDDSVRNGRTIVCSRLIASEQAADVAMLVVICRRAYEIGLRSGGHHSVLSTHRHRVALFERFGYHDTGRIVADPIAGPQHILILDLLDVERLARVNSPLLPVALRTFQISTDNTTRMKAVSLFS